MMSKLQLDGKVALVTGGTRGIGAAIVSAFAAEGARVIYTGRSSLDLLHDQADQVSKECGCNIIARSCDVSNPASITALYRDIFATFKGLDILVNNAGILGDSLIGMIQDTMIDQVISTNVSGQIRSIQSAARLMQRNGGGSIINLTSIVGLRGDVGQIVYAASKAAVVGMTLAAAKELGPKKIRVNAIAPGFIETDMIAGISAATRAKRIAGIPFGRPGTSNEVADVALFLASDLSRYVTGQVLGVDGGMVI